MYVGYKTFNSKLLLRPLYTVFFLLTFCVSFAQPVNHWETLVYDSVYWKFLEPTFDVPTTWAQPSYNDGLWEVGMGGFGKGDGDDSTIITGNSVYLRHQFEVTNPSELLDLILSIDYDDGYVAYLNGTEVARRNMGPVGSTVLFSDFATGDHEALLYGGGIPEGIQIDEALLVLGTNTLAVQAHNRAANSSDVSCRPFLFAGTSSVQNTYGVLPAWFTPPIQFSSNLPIVVLNTLGQNIPDDPRIVIQMGIINNGAGNTNFLNDPFNEYDGLINIERRGSSSQSFPKKQYAFETQDSTGSSLDVSLLGMPIENDWILHAPFSDKTLIRNYLVYNWWREMGWYSTRTAFCEVILNGDYQGVYILMEQIKWDNDRVDIEKLDADDNEGDSLTGGYIIKVDKTTGSGQTDWASHVTDFQGQNKNIFFQYDYPKRDTITPQQEDYIQEFVYEWEQALVDSTCNDPAIGYRKFVDVNSFIDYFLIEELTKNVDGYRLSTYLNKQRNSRGGKLQAGPVWDFNITLGNADYCEGGETEGWALDFPCDQSYIPFWWHRMNQDSVYWKQVQCRWWELRSDLFSWPSIYTQIDQTVALLGDAIDRNFQRWDILNAYVWPNNFVGGSHEAEVNYLKSWLQQRIQWLDDNIGQPEQVCQSALASVVTVSEINYHSSDTLDTEDWFELQNLGSDTVDLSFWTLKDGNEFNTFSFPMGTYLLPDSFLVVVRNEMMFANFNPNVTNRVGPFNWGIGNGGDRFTLHDFQNDFVFILEFDDESPWPTAPDGNSQTLEKWEWASDLNDPSSWHEGCPGGSPGRSFTYCMYTDISAAESRASSNIYPNPATDQFWIESDDWSAMNIYNSVGQKVQENNLYPGRTNVDVKSIGTGVYLVELVSHSGERSVQRLIIH